MINKNRLIVALTACVGFATSSQAELVHHWPVEKDTAGTLIDVVGGVDLTYIDPDEGTLSPEAAKPEINSTQGFTVANGGDATSADPDDLFQAQSFSVALWTRRLIPTTGGSAGPMFLGVIENESEFNHNYLLRSNPDGSTVTWFSRSKSDGVSGSRTIALTSSVGIDDGEWHHLAATFSWSGVEGSPATATVYVDGVETGTLTEPNWDGWNAAEMTQGGIGQDGFTSQGDFDDLRIYDNVLSQAEIEAIMKGVPATQPRITDIVYDDMSDPGNIIVTITFDSRLNKTYSVYHSTDFNDPVIERADVTDSIPGSDGETVFEIDFNDLSIPIDGPRRFFVVREN
ncbi:MAG: hypothetical protein ACI8XO_000585 [Verrucomicrobiales bacterium]|jgi:hypothetical protein